MLRLHKRISGLLFISAIPFAAACAQEHEKPEQAVRNFLTALRTADWKTFSELIHPDELVKFRAILAPAVAADTSGMATREIFKINNPAEFSTLSDSQVFEHCLMNSILAYPESLTAMATMRVEILNTEPHGDDSADVRYRMTVDAENTPITSVETLSLKRHGQQWRILLDASAEDLGKEIASTIKVISRPSGEELLEYSDGESDEESATTDQYRNR